MTDKMREMTEKAENGSDKQLTRYVVQRLVNFEEGLAARSSPTWVDLTNGKKGTIFEAENGRKAVQLAMTANDLQDGDFRAIPETSAKVHSPRVKTQIVWQ